MNCAKLVLVFGLLIVDAAALQASNPIKLVRQPLSNGEAIKLNMQAQEQMGKRDFDSDARYAEQALTVKGISLVASKMIQRHLEQFKHHKPVRLS